MYINGEYHLPMFFFESIICFLGFIIMLFIRRRKYIKEGEYEKLRDFMDDKVREYIGFGGIRIEDDLLVTDGGCRIIGSKKIPATVEEIEAFMAR